MFRDLKESFPDRATLVPSIVEMAIIFIKRLESSLEENEEFQDRFLDKAGSSRVDIGLHIHDSSNPKILFTESRDFKLFLPALNEQGYRSIGAIFADDLTKIFDESHPEETLSPPSANIPKALQNLGGSTQHVTRTTQVPHVHALPSLKSLSRPETLFSHTLPYILLVRRSGNRNIEIEGNHSPTLELIAGYFEKFARKSIHHTDSPPYFSVVKTSSPFGSGTHCDLVRIKRTMDHADWLGAGVTMVLAFAEGICGYEFISSHDGEFFFRRTVPFINLPV